MRDPARRMTTHPEETNERLSQKSQVYEKSERQGMEPYVSGDEFTVEIIRDLREVESVCEFWNFRKLVTLALIFSGLIGLRGNRCNPYTKQAIEFGYRFTDITGDLQIYNTMFYLLDGPRLLNFTTEMRSLDAQ